MFGSPFPKEMRSHFVIDPEPVEAKADSSIDSTEPIDHLMAVVIQIQDLRRTLQALSDMGLVIIRLASTGVFLGRRNVTLLIGFPEDKLESIVEVIHQNCRQREEYISAHLEGAPMPIPIATPITIGGGTVFTLAIDRFEEM